MPNPQIQIRWNSNYAAEYRASLDALLRYNPPPAVKGKITLTGAMPPQAIEEIIAIAQEYDAEIGLVLTGTWDKDAAVQQLRLFPPDQPQWAKDLNIDSATGELLG